MDIRASQVLWMEERIRAGGHPLFLIQWDDTFFIVPGAHAAALRAEPTRESILRRCSSTFAKSLPVYEFLTILRNPENEYKKSP
jgi:hypothetical protein